MFFPREDHEIFLITAKAAKDESGMIATWIIPGSLIPDRLRIIVPFSPKNFTFELIQKSKKFVVHLLAEDQVELVPRFGLFSGRNKNKFEGMKHERTTSGIPLIPGVVSWIECAAETFVDGGDRVICIANVLSEHATQGKRHLTKHMMLERLSPDIIEALTKKRFLDGERDRALRKPITPIASRS